MKILTQVSCLLLLLTGQLQAALYIPQPYPDWCLKVEVGGEVGGSVMLRGTNADYVITARHLLFNWDRTNSTFKLKANTASFTSLSTNNDESKIEIELDKMLAHDQLRYSRSHDVAVMKLWDHVNITNRANIVNQFVFVKVQYSSTNAMLEPVFIRDCKRAAEVELGAETISVGFSSSASSLHPPEAPDMVDASMPLLRKGIVAGAYKKYGIFILDSRVYPGDSGGPVLMKIHEATFDQFYFIGIQTMIIPGKDKWATNLSNSGYSIIEPLDGALDMLW